MDTPNAPPGAPATAPRVQATPVRRSTRRHGLTGLVIRAGLLAGLAWLTWAGATGSKALDEAAAAEARGDYPAALTAATEHLDRRPWSLEASRIVARCLSRLDFAEQAEPYYRRGGSLSVADLRYRAYGLTRANLRERAILAFDEVLERQPDDIASLRLKAGVFMSMSRWYDVAGVGRRLSAATPGPTEVETPITLGGHWTFRPRIVESIPVIGTTLVALAAHHQGETEDAVAACEKVLALDPGLASMPLDRRLFWSLFGEDLLFLGRATDLIRLLAAEDAGRTDARLVALMADAHTQLGAIAEAESCWRRVLELAPNQPAALLNLGRIELGRGNPEEAARLLARAASLVPGSVDAAYNLGLTYRRLGRVDEAREWERETARRRHLLEEKSRSSQSPPPSPAPKTS